jgi:hypothetical protein
MSKYLVETMTSRMGEHEDNTNQCKSHSDHDDSNMSDNYA